MAISLSQYNIGKKKQSIADKLAGQTQDLQQEPWWKTVGSVALPLIASLAMPGIGGALAGMAGQGGALASLLGTGKLATGIAKTVGTIGKGLQAAKKGQGILSTLGQIGTKAGYNMLTQKATGGLMGALDPKSASDLKLTDREQLYGGDALKKLRGDYKSAKEAEKQTGMSGAVLSAIASQGLGNIKDAFGVGLFNKAAPKGANMLEGLIGTGVEGAENIANVQELMGNKPSNLQDIMSGKKFINDASMRSSVDSQQNLFQGLLQNQAQDLTSGYDFSQGQGIASKLGNLPPAEDISAAAARFPGMIPQGSMDLGDLSPDVIKQLLSSYYNYEDADNIGGQQ